MKETLKEAPLAIQALRKMVLPEIVRDGRPRYLRALKVIFDAEWNEDLHPRDEAGKFTFSGEGAVRGTGESGTGGPGTGGSGSGNKREETPRERLEREKYEKVKEVTDRRNEALDNNDRAAFLSALKECHETEGYDSRGFEEWRERTYPEEEKSGALEIERDDKAAAILTSLSPNELRDLYPYCRGRSDEELQGYFDTQDVWDTPRNMTDDEYAYVNVRGYTMKAGCSWDKVGKLKEPLSEREIVNKLAFKDKDGYCASLAQAYLLNRHGYDVTDGKDEASREFFSRTSRRLEDYAHMDERHGYLPPKEIMGFLKEKVRPGEEYYFAVAGHAAVVRKTGTGNIEFLEMQSYKWNNGWQALTEHRLRSRFDHKENEYTHARLVSGRELAANQEYIREMGYINNTRGDNRPKRFVHEDD